MSTDRGVTQKTFAMPDDLSRSPSARLSPNPAATSSATVQVPNMRLVFDQPADGTTLTRSISGPNPPATVEVRFEPQSSSEQLIGQPTQWCNAPGPGQPLIYNVPVPGAGNQATNTLTVSSTVTQAGIRVPITIKHGV